MEIIERPPIAGEILLDVTTTAFVMRVPDAWKGKVVAVLPMAASVALRFGTSFTNVVVYAQAASVDAGTGVITAHADTGRRFVDGTARRVRFPEGNYNFLGIDASGTGVLTLALVDGQ